MDSRARVSYASNRLGMKTMVLATTDAREELQSFTLGFPEAQGKCLQTFSWKLLKRGEAHTKAMFSASTELNSFSTSFEQATRSFKPRWPIMVHETLHAQNLRKRKVDATAGFSAAMKEIVVRPVVQAGSAPRMTPSIIVYHRFLSKSFLNNCTACPSMGFTTQDTQYLETILAGISFERGETT